MRLTGPNPIFLFLCLARPSLYLGMRSAVFGGRDARADTLRPFAAAAAAAFTFVPLNPLLAQLDHLSPVRRRQWCLISIPSENYCNGSGLDRNSPHTLIESPIMLHHGTKACVKTF